MGHTEFCQSCGMPTDGNADLHGTNTDGSKNSEYCVYCYKDGAFTADVNMEQMIESCVPHVVAAVQGMTEDTARSMMREQFPTLKRWRDQ
ncbi:zinc ribbon domain-containing protein [Paenibacillus cymbidii]|uniref:zinc ribbon domain-containing protein n=1 Tax=Paenibacillus cymbidii TaxID=1639034 RepID=UPI0010805DFB|nr:zinc ribbon domain-containing protein [Paenibacillus cymbidii]